MATVIGLLESISQSVGKNLDGLDKIASSLGGLLQVPTEAASDPREEVLVRYTVGTGEFSADKKYNVLRMKMYKMNGEQDGTHDGVWEPQGDFKKLFERPDPPQGPLDQPAGPIEHVKPRAFTKAIWTFGDGSSVTGVGPAMLHFVKFTDGAVIFLVSVASIITNGTGRYDGAYGVKTALGSTFVPKGVNMLNPPGGKFGAVTVETFRIVRKEFI